MHPLPKWILIGSWALCCLVWAVMALRAKRDIRSQTIDEREPYFIPFVASLFLMIISTYGPVKPEDGGAGVFVNPLVPLTPALEWWSAGLALTAAILAVWARWTLGRNWSGMVALKDEHELVISGPYALIRHPIYTALILLVLATALANRASFSFAAVLLMILSCWLKLRAEEDLLSDAFPDHYPAYVARTKRLLPWLL